MKTAGRSEAFFHYITVSRRLHVHRQRDSELPESDLKIATASGG
jgi:hypothetical protein